MEIFLRIVSIGIGGFVGATCRYGMSGLAHRVCTADFPAGTLLVNVVGSFILGFILQIHARYFILDQNLHAGLCIGMLGAFTTFSTFSYETFRLVESGDTVKAGLNIAANLLCCLVAVWLGTAGARLVAGRM